MYKLFLLIGATLRDQKNAQGSLLRALSLLGDAASL